MDLIKEALDRLSRTNKQIGTTCVEVCLGLDLVLFGPVEAWNGSCYIVTVASDCYGKREYMVDGHRVLWARAFVGK